ncbi:MAG: amidase family protein, partial [Hyphomicrobium sp.]
MTDLTKLTLSQARDGLAKKTFKAAELTDAFIAAIEKANPAINAYVLQTPDHARAQAKESDKRIAAGKAGLLEGLPLGNKDL